LRLNSSRSRGSSALAVVGSCLGVYVVLAVAFHWLMEPTVAKNQGVAPYEPSPARIVQASGPPSVPPVRSGLPSRVTSKPPTSATATTVAPKSTETARSELPSRVAPPMTVTAAAPKSAETARSELPSRVAPPMTVTAAAPKSTETARSEPPRVAPEPPTSAPVAAAAPKSAETARSGLPSLVAPEPPTSATVAAAVPESTETAATEPKKTPKKAARKTARHERPARDFWNPFKFFAGGPSNGSRPSF
jgi:hypothetical protein